MPPEKLLRRQHLPIPMLPRLCPKDAGHLVVGRPPKSLEFLIDVGMDLSLRQNEELVWFIVRHISKDIEQVVPSLLALNHSGIAPIEPLHVHEEHLLRLRTDDHQVRKRGGVSHCQRDDKRTISLCGTPISRRQIQRGVCAISPLPAGPEPPTRILHPKRASTAAQSLLGAYRCQIVLPTQRSRWAPQARTRTRFSARSSGSPDQR